MKIMVLGSGLMGPAAAYILLGDPTVGEVVLADMRLDQLEQAKARLGRVVSTERLRLAQVDLADRPAAAEALAAVDVVVAALPSAVVPLGLRAATAARTHWVDLSWPPQGDLPELTAAIEEAGTLAIFGCGVEPGLTEIMARYVAEKLDRADELHIMCGGIPVEPAPPLGYKIVFGGTRLPLREPDAHVVENGELKTAPRYSGVEHVTFAGVGEVEAWHEGFMPWLLDLDALQGLQVGTQKTVRWPGYAAKATALRELGLLSTASVEVRGVAVSPKDVVDTVLYDRVRMAEHDRDITAFRVEALGEKKGHPGRYRVEMVDRYDERTGFTSMARVTAFTGAMVARMVGAGRIEARGVLTPEKVITGRLFDQLVDELAAQGVTFILTQEKSKVLGQ
ncbi:MAG: saccharopine dehydrogenase NADP-binding domain-containing protein [Caldilineaceae bacterium]|nr:saccharopine dehydrogenase NADP-binding domain-containing protein [Caldilineaceae bacterium]